VHLRALVVIHGRAGESVQGREEISSVVDIYATPESGEHSFLLSKMTRMTSFSMPIPILRKCESIQSTKLKTPLIK